MPTHTQHNLMAPEFRLNAACPYFTMFKLSVPHRILVKHAEAKRVLDPFCGRGTSLYAARMQGRESVGIDLNPVAAAISRAKIARVNIARISASLNESLAMRPQEIPLGEFWDYCFHSKTLTEICSLREYLMSAKGNSADILRAVSLGLLHGPTSKIGSYFSNQMPRTYSTKPQAALRYWRKHRLRAQRVDVAALLRRRLQYLLTNVPPASGGKVYCHDALSLLPRLEEKADLVITSPPYLGLRTYLPDQWLRLWFIGGPTHVIYEQGAQIGVACEVKFCNLLSLALDGMDKATTRGAHAYLLLGSIPSMPTDVPKLMRRALDTSKTAWRLVSTHNHGRADAGKRQAKQFHQRSIPKSEYLFHLAKAV